VTERVQWEQARAIIEKAAGPVLSARPVGSGLNSELAVIINDRYFVKGLREGHPRVWTQEQEKAVNPYVRHVSAPLEWGVVADGWSLLGFGYMPGRQASYRPGSPDLELITEMMSKLPAAPGNLDLKRAEQRWSGYSEQAGLFAGDHLSHTDWSPGNVLVADDARLVDWAWPTRGTAWIDPACWIVWLIACGHSPAQAESHAARVPAFAQAPGRAMTAFSAAQAAMWDEIGKEAPHPGLAAAAVGWHRYREHD